MWSQDKFNASARKDIQTEWPCLSFRYLRHLFLCTKNFKYKNGYFSIKNDSNILLLLLWKLIKISSLFNPLSNDQESHRRHIKKSHQNPCKKILEWWKTNWKRFLRSILFWTDIHVPFYPISACYWKLKLKFPWTITIVTIATF